MAFNLIDLEPSGNAIDCQQDSALVQNEASPLPACQDKPMALPTGLHDGQPAVL